MKRAFLGLLVSPLLIYPVTAGLLLLGDTFRGERLLSFYVRYEQRLLWDTFWSDYAASLPAAYAIAAVVVAAFLVGRGIRSIRPVPYFVTSLAVGGWAAAWYLTGSFLGATHVALSLSGGLVGLPLAILTGSTFHSHGREMAR